MPVRQCQLGGNRRSMAALAGDTFQIVDWRDRQAEGAEGQ